MTYEHTQSSPYLAAALLAGVFGTVILAVVVADPFLLITTAVLALVGVITHALSTITTTVTPETITVAFRWGRPSRTMARRQVVRADVVRNKWWYGWGIRWIPGATMYNVWGLDAVHLELAGGRDFRIGTDDLQGLAAAINDGVEAGR